MKTATLPILVTLALVCFGLAPLAQAVIPPPDGGYPGGNTAEGQNALFNLSTGGNNTAVGFVSLKNNTTGSYNTAVGAGTLFANTADENTATGFAALLLNSAGIGNTATGAFALLLNTMGNGNTGNGGGALQNNSTGNANTATGEAALFNNTSGSDNTANGDGALVNNATGEGNVAVGSLALHSNIAGFQNTAVGTAALFNTTGTGNIAIGNNAGTNVAMANNVICIGAGGADTTNSCYIGNIFNNTSSAGTAVFINSDGKLGTTTSSKRFKKEIKPMDKASQAIFALKPVSFRYKRDVDPIGTSQLGLVAEDVEAVNPDLIVRDENGKPYSVRYDQVNAMLLNEFLKEHRAFVQEQRKVQRLEKRIEEIAAGLQKVSAQIELKNPVAQIAANHK